MLEINGLQTQILKTLNYNNKENKPKNYVMALKLSNLTESQIDYSNIDNLFSLYIENMNHADGTISRDNKDQQEELLFPREEK